jgi:hypothetical protein
MSDSEKKFKFDAVFDGNSATPEAIYDACARPVVGWCLEGYYGTIFAYGGWTTMGWATSTSHHRDRFSSLTLF